MIIGARSQILAYDIFTTGIQRSVKGVTRVALAPGSEGHATGYATGWLITDTLVVLPGFAVIGMSAYRCRVDSGPEEDIVAELVAGPATAKSLTPGLLRLRQEQSAAALTLGDQIAEPNDLLFILHHPEGNLEPCLSVGRVLGNEGAMLRHDADTRPGSSGAPVFDGGWSVIGMHMRSAGGTGSDASFNMALSLAAILEWLRTTPAWDEIARYHKLADVAAARAKLKASGDLAAAPGAEMALTRAAVLWSFEPSMFSPADRERLKPLVVSTSAERWTLRARERQRVIRLAGSLESLRAARGPERTDSDMRQLAIDRILDGPPYRIEQIDEQALPYLLQTVRWFADVEPELPTPEAVNRTLERKLARSRLERLAGPDFCGRDVQLNELRAWYGSSQVGPMIITGIGGIGKSTLVAKFALGLGERSLFLWLDFDRADLAPDDAVSMLSQLIEQAAVQRDDFSAAAIEKATWRKSATDLGKALAQSERDAPPPLLVLDDFEIAQHVQEHEEIWELLNLVLAEIPNLHILISGRAEVEKITLGGVRGRVIALKGMARRDAQAWLEKRGVTDKHVLERVLDICDGMPLALVIALRLIAPDRTAAGHEIEQLPERLPGALVVGYLYQRILDRVVDPSLKQLAEGALALRRLTAPMLPDLLGEFIEEGVDPEDLFARLARELALVEGSDIGQAGAAGPAIASVGDEGVLRLRPEVRSATLKLLELHKAELVRKIDSRAADWYSRQDLNDPANAAELVYHSLRLRDLVRARCNWSAPCAPLLVDAENDLPATALEERRWLFEKTRGIQAGPVTLDAWERDALERIKSKVSRGLARAVPGILAERSERTPASPLVLFDALTRGSSGDVKGARDLLAAGECDGPVRRDRDLLGAVMASRAGQRSDADCLLAKVDDASLWRDRPNGALEAIAVRAARVRLTVDLSTELELALKLEADASGAASGIWLSQVLTPMEVLLPSLASRVGNKPDAEVLAAAIKIPETPKELRAFAAALDRERRRKLDLPGASFSAAALPGFALPEAQGGPTVLDVELQPGTTIAPDQLARARDLAELGRRRWQLATTDLFLAEAWERAYHADEDGASLGISIIGTLTAFRASTPGATPLPFVGRTAEIRDMDPPVKRRKLAEPDLDDDSLMAAILRHEEQICPPAALPSSGLIDASSPATITGALRPGERVPAIPPLFWLRLYLLTPDPLDVLLRRIIGLPDIHSEREISLLFDM